MATWGSSAATWGQATFQWGVALVSPGRARLSHALTGQAAIEMTPAATVNPVIYVGQRPTLRVRFSVNGLPTDPTTVTLKIKDPSGATTSYTYAAGDVSKEAAGVYSRRIELSAAGAYTVLFEGTNACEAVNQTRFTVYATGV